MSGSRPDDPAEALSGLARELASHPAELGERTLDVLRARSPELVRRSEESGGDPVATSTGFMQILVGSLRSDVDVPWKESERRSREYGLMRAAQGVPLETLIDELAVYRRATIELISLPIQDSSRRDEVVNYAQAHLEDVIEHLTAAVACGYVDSIVAQNHARRTEILRSARNRIGGLKRVAQKLRRVAQADRIRNSVYEIGWEMSTRGHIAVSFGVAAWQSVAR